MIESFEEWSFRPPAELTEEQKRWLLQNRSYLAEYIKGCRNDITKLPLLEFIEVIESGEPCIFCVADLPINTLKWLAVSDMEDMDYHREGLIAEAANG
mgnify:CR=1 FL=1